MLPAAVVSESLAALQTLSDSAGAQANEPHALLLFLSQYCAAVFKDQRIFLAQFDPTAPMEGRIKRTDPMVFVGSTIARFAAKFPPPVEGHTFSLFAHLTARLCGFRCRYAANDAESLERLRRTFFEILLQAGRIGDHDTTAVCLAQLIPVLGIHDAAVQLDLLAVVSESLRDLHLFLPAYSIECVMLQLMAQDISDPPIHTKFPDRAVTSRSTKQLAFLLSILAKLEQFEELQGARLVESMLVHRCQRAILLKQIGQLRATDNTNISDRLFESVIHLAAKARLTFVNATQALMLLVQTQIVFSPAVLRWVCFAVTSCQLSKVLATQQIRSALTAALALASSSRVRMLPMMLSHVWSRRCDVMCSSRPILAGARAVRAAPPWAGREQQQLVLEPQRAGDAAEGVSRARPGLHQV